LHLEDLVRAALSNPQQRQMLPDGKHDLRQRQR
jgi:hypothetical protein